MCALCVVVCVCLCVLCLCECVLAFCVCVCSLCVLVQLCVFVFCVILLLFSLSCSPSLTLGLWWPSHDDCVQHAGCMRCGVICCLFCVCGGLVVCVCVCVLCVLCVWGGWGCLCVIGGCCV